MSASAKPYLHASRKHWGVENSLRWTLDVTLRESASWTRQGVAPENYVYLRHIALNIIRLNTPINLVLNARDIWLLLMMMYAQHL